MKLAFKALVPLLTVAALAAACNPFAPDSSRSAGSQDPRFAPFTVSSENEPVYGNDTDYLNHRMPNLGASEGHYAQILVADSTWMPVPETKFWFSGVAVASEETIAQLQQEIEGSAQLLPGIHPNLYQYVPQECEFNSIPADRANTVLDTAAHSYPNSTDSFTVSDLAISPDCHLVVMTAEGVNG